MSEDYSRRLPGEDYLYMSNGSHTLARTWQVTDSLLVDVTAEGQIIGIESLSGRVNFTDLYNILGKVYLKQAAND